MQKETYLKVVSLLEEAEDLINIEQLTTMQWSSIEARLHYFKQNLPNPTYEVEDATNKS